MRFPQATTLCLALAGLLVASDLATAAEPSKAEEELVLRVYPVADLLAPAPDYPYLGQGLPTAKPLRVPQAPKSPSPPSVLDGGGMGGGSMGGGGMGSGGMGGGMGGMGGGMGGGMFQIPAEGTNSDTASKPSSEQSNSAQPASAGPAHPGHDSRPYGFDNLIQAITSTVNPISWEEVGGDGTIAPYGTQLLIQQTPAIHEKIARLLEMMRSEAGTGRSLVVEAAWLPLDSQQLEKLLVGSAATGWATTIEPKTFEEMVRNVPSYRGQLACFNRQTVHMISGNRRVVIIGQIPVVGGPVGYQPIVAMPNLGVLLQVTPSLVPGTQEATLDLHSTVTEWIKPDPPQVLNVDYPPTTQTETDGVTMAHAGGRTTAEVDRLNILTQELETSVRIPLNKPVLVGGLTQDPNSPAPEKQDRKQLYLVVRVRSAEMPPPK